MFYIIALLLLIIVLANEKSRALLIGLIITLFFIAISGLILTVIVFVGWALYSGNFSLRSATLWLDNISSAHPLIAGGITLLPLLAVLIHWVKYKIDSS